MHRKRTSGVDRTSIRPTTVAIPVAEGRVSPLLDTAARYLVVHFQQNEEVGRRTHLMKPLPVQALVKALAELGMDVLLCAAISEPLRRGLERSGVRVTRHLCGEAEALLHAFGAGTLDQGEFRMPGCRGRHVEGECFPPPETRLPGSQSRPSKQEDQGLKERNRPNVVRQDITMQPSQETKA